MKVKNPNAGKARGGGGLGALAGESASIDGSNQSTKNGLDKFIKRNAEVTHDTKTKDEDNNDSANLLASKSAKLLASTGFDYLVTLYRSLG